MSPGRVTRRTVLRSAASLGGLAATGGGLASLTSCGSAAPRTVRIAAGDPGGIYVAFARLLARRLGERVDGLDVEVLSTAGTVENLALLSAGDAELGLGLADGVAATAMSRPPAALARVYENYLQLVVLADGPVARVEDLAGRTLVNGARGSGAALTGQAVLEAAGVADRVRIRHATLAASIDALAAGDVDALTWSGGIPTPALAELDRRISVRMLDLGPLVPRLQQGFDYSSRRVPSVGYGPPEAEARTLGVPNLLLARPGLDADVAAEVVVALAEDAARLVPTFVRGLQYLSPGTMIQTGEVPLHPGALAAYRRLHP